MSYVSSPRDVRVTRKGVRLTPGGQLTQVTPQFIPGDVSPVSTHNLELAKGAIGWSDYENKPEVVSVNGGVVSGGSDPYAFTPSRARMIPKRRPTIVRVVSAGPTAAYREAKRRSEELAARDAR